MDRASRKAGAMNEDGMARDLDQVDYESERDDDGGIGTSPHYQDPDEWLRQFGIRPDVKAA
jgi:hypothetical protein